VTTLTQPPLKVYADTSVYGGAFDEEFDHVSRSFFDGVRQRRFALVVSPIVEREIEGAPREVLSLWHEMRKLAEVADVSPEAIRLQEAYLRARIVSPQWDTDALHVALATVTGCRAIISWNFKHIVHLRKIALYNGVNRVQGYGEIAIHTPQEVIDYESEDV
jgi:hypothetical protein